LIRLAGTSGALLAFLAATTVLVLAEPAAVAPQQVFRLSTDLVAVDVAVRQGSQAVKGLTSGDFELVDNGIRQSVEAVSIEEVPVDLSLLLDASSSTAAVIEQFKANAAQIAAMLRERDRVRLVAFSTSATEIFPLTGAGAPLPVQRLAARGSTSLHDALTLTLIRMPREGRRQLVLVFSDGHDTTSVISGTRLAEVASRSDCVLHVVVTQSTGSPPATARSLRAAAEATGGALHTSDDATDAVTVFLRLYEDFRQSYVLRYTLTGVPSPGWHDVGVRVVSKDARRYTVRARRGYFGG
jgi:VWFA-related protein